jgi:hypothetical protein
LSIVSHRSEQLTHAPHSKNLPRFLLLGQRRRNRADRVTGVVHGSPPRC